MKKLHILILYNIINMFYTTYGMQHPSPTNPLSSVSESSITKIYELAGGNKLTLYIPKNILMDKNEKIVDLKKLFEQYNLQPSFMGRIRATWDQEEWQEAASKLLETNKDDSYFNKEKSIVYLDNVAQLLIDAKKVAKSLLAIDNKFSDLKENYIRKSGTDRIFTYAKLKDLINKKKFAHIKLPKKFLVVENRKTGNPINFNDAQKIIDEKFKLIVVHPGLFHPGMKIRLVFDSEDEYRLTIYAHKESKKGKGFSKKTMEELLELCKEAPFDIGYDNIFWDSKGDAIIIDTEYKGTHATDCEKLGRYPVDSSL